MKTSEAQRLKELLELQILDTPPEPEFDEITLLASEICQVPTSSVSIIDSQRQWFKSRHNNATPETRREDSICQYLIGRTKPLVIPDTSLDPLVRHIPVVQKGEVRFYAGAPLVTKSGFGIGSLCVADSEPRDLSSRQIQALVTLSRNVIHLIELRRHTHQMKALAQQVAQREMMLLEAAKMSSLGQMAGGIAHEINNPLTIISINTIKIQELARSGKVDLNLLAGHAQRIQSTTDRIARIIRGMREFCGDAAKEPLQVVNLKDLIEGTLSFCQDRKVRLGISFKYIQSNPDIQIECRAVQISQLLLNLISNACDALKESNPKILELEVHQVGDHIQIQLLDSGVGIPLEVQEKIFHPFFTTKEIGQGIGLGLSIAKGIVEAHNGQLTFRSSPAGTTFKILLPKTQN